MTQASNTIPTTQGRYRYLKIGKKYDSRTLLYALERALRGEPLNGEQRVCFAVLRVQLQMQLAAERKEK